VKKKLLLLGCGNLGSLLLESWISSNIELEVIEKNKTKSLVFKKLHPGIKFHRKFQDLSSRYYDFTVLCIKPPELDKANLLLNCKFFKTKNLISLMAGINIKKLEKLFDSNTNIFRVMPNILASVSHSSTALFSKKKISNELKEDIEDLFIKIGKIMWLKKETDINFFTALYGGGPAYILHFFKNLIEISEKNGISKKDSSELVKSMLFGSAEYLKKNKKSLDSIISIVTSKGGTTEEAIKFLNKKNQILNLLASAINKAKKKSLLISKKYN
tara:strand:- start:54830 stop:55645 length:816 start_codon:yes stop_codon:yes gene_type:complete